LHRPLLAEKPDIVVATPSKALTHLEAENMVLRESLENLVIDEADLVLSFGYEDDLRKILSYLPKIYQSFLMSATFTKVKMHFIFQFCASLKLIIFIL
jgi:ATP-dependent RNA helicase DDX56/DBP9